MTKERFLRNLLPPAGPVDVVLDTDAYNEVDDQLPLPIWSVLPIG